MIVREAQKNDTGQILVLMKQLINEHAALDKYYKPFSKYRGLRDYISGAIKNPDQLLLVAETDGEIVGYILTAIEEAPFYSSEKLIGVVADAAVEKKYRRQGILTVLFKDALKWLGGVGINYVELSVDARNSSAVSVWRKLGFKDYKLRLRRLI